MSTVVVLVENETTNKCETGKSGLSKFSFGSGDRSACDFSDIVTTKNVATATSAATSAATATATAAAQSASIEARCGSS